MTKPPSRIRRFFEQRYPVAAVSELALHKTVPIHKHTFWYYWGGMTLFLIGIQFITGILLLLYYRPSAQHAYESVHFIMTKVEFGWLVRSIHAWSANLAIFTAVVHLVSAFFMKAYRPPRELTWVTGVVMLGLLMAFGFTGYLLPWNTLAYFATKVGTEIAGVLPVAGPVVQTFLRGGSEVGDITLTRFFWLHVAVLPIIVFALMGLHLLFVQFQGMSKPIAEKSQRSMPFVPNFLLRDLITWALVLAAVLALSVYMPAELGTKADPLAPTPVGIQPEWYFLWMFETLKFFPSHVLGIEGELLAVIVTGIAGAAVLLVPWIDRPARREKSHWAVWLAGILMLLYVIATTLYSHFKGGH